jgi:uncharacterized oligopeptide transporter (OPT) family protein
MAEVLAKDLKLGQYMHLAPRATFFVQMSGCIIGALFNYIMYSISLYSKLPSLTKAI